MSPRGRLFACAGIGVAIATLVVYLLVESIACPAGYGDPEPKKGRSGANKIRLDIVCYSPEGSPLPGSTPLVVVSWLGIALVTSTASWFAVKKWAPVSVEPVAAAPTYTAPSDKREARKKRKREQRGA